MSDPIDADICAVLSARGGKRQRSIALAPSDPTSIASSSTASYRAHTWALNGASSVDISRIATRIRLDHRGQTHPVIDALSMRSEGNFSRTWKRVVNRAVITPNMSFVKTKVFDMKNRPVPKAIELDYPLVFPHDWMSWLHEHWPDQSDLRVRGGMSEHQLKAFWESVPRDDTTWDHSGIYYGMDMGAVSPAVSHSDFVPITQDATKTSLLAISTIPVFGIGTTL